MAAFAFQVNGASDTPWFLTIAREATGVGVGGECPTSIAAALESSNGHFDYRQGPIQVLISTLMATPGGPICTLVYLATLLASNNNLRMAYHAMYLISIFLPLIVVFFRLKMHNGLLFRKSNFKKKYIPWQLVIQRYWL